MPILNAVHPLVIRSAACLLLALAPVAFAKPDASRAAGRKERETPAGPSVPVADAELQRKLAAYLAAHTPKGVAVSATLVDTDSGKVLADVGGNRPLAPASNLKLVTSAAALDVLGPDFKFETLLLSRPGAAGTRPSLIVVGDGDPAFFDPKTLEAAGLDEEKLTAAWLGAAKKNAPAGYGALWVDDRIFDNQGVPKTWPKDQLDDWYAVPVSGLTFHDNVFHVTPHPTKPGAGVNVDIWPLGDFVTVKNTAVTVGPKQKDEFLVACAPGNVIRVGGKIPYEPQEPFRLKMDDAPMVFGQWFAGRLAKAGVPVAQVGRVGADTPKVAAGDVVIHKIQTPIQAALNRTNRDSYNLYAECLLKRMEVKATGHQGSFAGGAAAVRQALVKRLGEGALAGYTQIDGCGLSRGNRVTSRLMAELIASVDRDPKLTTAWRTSMARPGMAGSTFAHRFQHVRLSNEVYGKSGYISGVSALSGLVVHKTDFGNGKSASFSILCNAQSSKAAFDNRSMKALQEGVVKLLDESMAKK